MSFILEKLSKKSNKTNKKIKQNKVCVPQRVPLIYSSTYAFFFSKSHYSQHTKWKYWTIGLTNIHIIFYKMCLWTFSGHFFSFFFLVLIFSDCYPQKSLYKTVTICAHESFWTVRREPYRHRETLDKDYHYHLHIFVNQ